MANLATAQIRNSLQTMFAPLDVEVLAKSLVWIEARRAALDEFKASEEYKAMRGNAWLLYPHMFAMCGGKTWYNIINTCNKAQRAEFVTKNCEATAAKRNASIARKLDKAGVTEVVSSELAESHDGFNGFFIVNTDTGRKTVHVETIRAGGYNIQCLHLRVLVKVRDGG